MALTYLDFKAYPLEINGLTSDYNAKITAFETFVKADINYSGSASDFTAILPYFVFWHFCQDRNSKVDAQAGEMVQVAEYSVPSYEKQIKAWNMGVEKLRAVFGITSEALKELTNMTNAEKLHYLVQASGNTVNEHYLSKRSWL